MGSRCAVFTDTRFNGVCVRVTDLNDDGSIKSVASVVYTPTIARQVAHDILVEADKIDALGGPTADLSTFCVPASENKIRSGS